MDAACCSHLKVSYKTLEKDGVTTGWWSCDDCGMAFGMLGGQARPNELAATETEITDMVRCNHCMTEQDEDNCDCEKCGKDDAMMQPFIRLSQPSADVSEDDLLGDLHICRRVKVGSEYVFEQVVPYTRAKSDEQPVAYMRRWAYDKIDVMKIKKADRPHGWQFHAASKRKLFSDDVPLYAKENA